MSNLAIDNIVSINDIVSDAHEIASISADYQRADEYRKETLLKAITQKMDNLLGAMEPLQAPISPDDARSIMKNHHALTVATLSRIEPKMIPFIVVRELVSLHRTPIQRKVMHNWDKFQKNYSQSI